MAWADVPMAVKVLLGAICGLLIGLASAKYWECSDMTEKECSDMRKDPMAVLGILGQLWLRALSLVVLPLLFSNMVVVANTMASISSASTMGKATIVYYMTTTFIAVFTGVGTGLVIAPFVEPSGNLTATDMGVPPLMEMTMDELPLTLPRRLQDGLQDVTPVEQIQGILFSLVPNNIFQAFATFNLLGCIVFAFVLGLIVEKESLIVRLNSEINDASFAVIKKIIEWTPVGVAFLIAPNVMIIEWKDVQNAVYLVIGIPLGLIFHVLVIYPMIYFVTTRMLPFSYMKGMLPAVFTAMGTSSSAATLPMTLKCVMDLGISETIAKFVLTIGATANMDGSAIYFPIAVVWLAKTVGHVITIGDVVTLVFMCTLAAIGASPIPSSGLVLVKMISESINITGAGGVMPPLFSVIVALDPFFDRMVTMVNICGDGMGAGIIQSIAPPDEDTDGEVPVSVENSIRENLVLYDRKSNEVDMVLTASGKPQPKSLELPTVGE